MYFAYFDESGDSGFEGSPTNTFTLAAVLIHDSNWLSALDQSIAFRRYLKERFHFAPRDEIKASWLIHNKGPFRKTGLSYPARMQAYKAAMRFQRKAGVFETFAVIIVKDRIKKRDRDVREIAWQYAIQRLERFGTAKKDNIMICPDEGHGDLIKKQLRAMRRFHHVASAFGGGTLNRAAQNIVEDPFEKRSTESYFVQWADLNAYAAFRRAFPGNNFGVDIWDELGTAVLTDVNRLSGGPPGIVIWPAQ
ncbi:DUF3800 domain-containing protein [Pusillimonas sp. SM2304]|uniref:DUF3800 domain-containing protein n=1 Tax=Pusillimonas sp. SM2304 TaxID=3073241 RepID=UPI002874E86E|nr:DUF3800 domain-containing protein [Pusillimonas sp. SM2304]MDS1142417.1 DUF3800 domain-containing protein [Pusillimonas sp. SM2304]